MNNRAFTISLVIALLAVSMVYSYVSSTETFLSEKYGAEVTVVIAKRDIKELEVLDKTNLTTKAIPGTFKEPNVVEKMEDVQGGLASAPIGNGEQITRSKVIQAGVQSGLSRQVAIGKRAVTVNVNEANAVAKLVKPGDRVDVLTNVDPGGGNKFLIEVHTILQDVLVLATGKYITNTVPGILETDPYRSGGQKSVVRLNEYNSYSSVTLEVDPLQTQSLLFAEKNLGGIYLVLRNSDDSSKDDVSKTMLKDIMGDPNRGAARPAGPAPGGH